VTLFANTWSGGSSDGDSFVFAWSSNNSDFSDLFTVSSGNSANVQSAAIPDSGTIYIRVRDTNRVAGNKNLDTVFVDQLYIRSNNGVPPDPPEAPINLRVDNPGGSSLDLSWQHPSNDAASFDLESAPANDGPWTQVASPAGGSSSYTDSGLSSLTTYFYRIRARNSGGPSDWSNTDSGTTTSAPAISLTANGHKERGAHVINLDWSGTSGASVNVKRDGATIVTLSSANYVDRTGNKGGRSYVYQVCLAGTGTCSNSVTVAF